MSRTVFLSEGIGMEYITVDSDMAVVRLRSVKSGEGKESHSRTRTTTRI